MPEVDFMILCDHVRADRGVFHMIAAGIDRIHTDTVPAARNVGIAIRLSLTRVECQHSHQIELIFQDQDGERILSFTGVFEAKYPDDLPPGWPAHGAIPLNLALPLPRHGIYSLELVIDNQSKKSIGVLVAPVAPARGADVTEDH